MILHILKLLFLHLLKLLVTYAIIVMPNRIEYFLRAFYVCDALGSGALYERMRYHRDGIRRRKLLAELWFVWRQSEFAFFGAVASVAALFLYKKHLRKVKK